MCVRPWVLVYSLVLSLLTACAHDVRTSYPGMPPGQPVGSITVRLSHESEGVTVTVNGALVAEGKHTKKVTVTNVPAGPAEVVVAAGGGGNTRVEKTVMVDVLPWTDTAVAVASPEVTTGTWLYHGLYSLGAWIFLGAVYSALL
jgi:hypothetical protein